MSAPPCSLKRRGRAVAEPPLLRRLHDTIMRSIQRREPTQPREPSPLALDADEGDHRTRRHGLLRSMRVGVRWLVLVLIAAFVMNVVGIRLAGSIGGWHGWMSDHRLYFLVWRVLLYGATACGWIWMRRRLLQREGDDSTRRLLRVEAAGVLVTLLLEIHLWFGMH